MAMTQSTSTLTRGARKLRQLGADAISIPTTADLVRRKGEELDAARAAHATIVAKQLTLEKGTSRNPVAIAAVVAEKKAALELIDRLQGESEILVRQRPEKPRAPLTPREKFWEDALPVPAPSPYSAEEMREANAELERITAEMRMARMNGSTAQEMRHMPAYREAKLKLAVMAGGYRGEWPPYMPYATHEDRVAAMKKWGRK
jgi:hypothetical protein